MVRNAHRPGMDGYTFLRSLRGRQTDQGIPVVVVTGRDVAEVVPRVREHGVEHVIPKDGNVYPKLKAANRTAVGRPRPHARVDLPGPVNVTRPFLDSYSKTPACC